MNKKQNTNAILIAVVILIIIIVGWAMSKKSDMPQGNPQTGTTTGPKTTTGTKKPSTTPTGSQTTGGTVTQFPTTGNAETVKTYTDATYKFQFTYPTNFALVNGDNADYPQGSFLKMHGGAYEPAPVSLSAIVPPSTYPNSNFKSAWLAVAVDPALSNTNDCRAFRSGGSVNQLAEAQEVNGLNWYKGSATMVSGGLRTESRVYHVVHDAVCYEVSLNLVVSSIEGKNVDDIIWSQLQNIFSTLKFTK